MALLILSSAFFYFNQVRSQLLKAEHFSLIKYARAIKSGNSLKEFQKGYFEYKLVRKKVVIDIRNFTVKKDKFVKFIPTKDKYLYIKVSKTTQPYFIKLHTLKTKIITVQIVLLFVFGLISFFLAKNALKPLQESIDTLDKFAKDLIHDLNTPITAMQLNIKLLQRDEYIANLKPFERLRKSVITISQVQNNLTTLLEHKTFQLRKINLCMIIKDVLELHQPVFPNLTFKLQCDNFYVVTNKNAIKQVLDNLISNGCKYNRAHGELRIYTKEKKLFIEDTGIGIKEVDKIFQRAYSGHNSTGFGLDIVKRLCDAMGIIVEVNSSEKGSCFILTFN